MVAEIALAVMLLAGAGLLLRSFARLQQVDLGFQTAHVLKLHLTLPDARYDEDAKLRAFVDGLTERLEALPGVESAGATVYGLPLTGGVNVWSFTIDGPPSGAARARRTTSGPPWRLRDSSGRWASRSSAAGRSTSATATAPRGWPSSTRRRRASSSPARTRWANGSSSDARSATRTASRSWASSATSSRTPWRRRSSRRCSCPMPRSPARRWPWSCAREPDPAALIAAVTAQVRELDPDLPVYAVRTMEEVLALSAAQPKFYMLLLGGFALIALVLAAVGIYGVIGYTVRQRTQEIGIRMALGATRDRVQRMVVRQGMTLALSGAAAGLVGALVATRWMQSLLYQVSAMDPAIYSTVAVVLVAVAAVASWLPARRAAGTEPLLALRGQ